MASTWILLFGALTAISSIDCVSIDYYISPYPEKDCYIQGFPFERCYTLDQFANNSTLLSNMENVRLFVLDSDTLRSNNLTIYNTTNFQIVGKAAEKLYINIQYFTGIFIQAESNVEIANISIYGSMTFEANSVEFRNMTFTDCELNLTGELITVSYSTFDNCYPINIASSYSTRTHRELETLYERKLILLSTRIENSEVIVIPLHQENLHLKTGNLNVTIKHSFLRMTDGTYNQPITLNLTAKMTVFITLVLTHCIGCINIYTHNDSNSLKLHIEQSKIEEPLYYPAIKLVMKKQSANNSIHVLIVDSIIREDHGSGLLLRMESTLANTVYMNISNCTMTGWKRALDICIDDSNPLSNNDRTNNYLRLELDDKASICIVIQRSTFKHHKTALFAEISMHLNILFNLSVINSTFERNERGIEVTTKRTQILTPQNIPASYSYTFVLLKHIRVENNVLPFDLASAIIKAAYINMLIIEDCEFGNNKGTAVQVLFSDVTFSGNTNFFNNRAVRGGALSLHHSYMYLSKSVTVSFTNNHAQEVGGAMNVNQLDDSMCFYQAPVNAYSVSWSSLHFIQNSAKRGGDNIYGGSLHRNCKYSFDSTHNMSFINDVFQVQQNKTLSSVSSNPTRVCLCDNEGIPQCAKLDYMFVKLSPRYPGEIFTISAVLVGYDFGTVPGNIYAHSFIENYNAQTSIGFKQRLQEVKEHQQCVQLEYSIQSPLTNTLHIIQLNVSQNAKREPEKYIKKKIETYHNTEVIETELLSQPVLLYVSLDDCPVGFSLSNSPPYVCQCHPKLLQNSITRCIIFDHIGRVYRTGTVWVSAAFVENTTNDFVVHQYCSYDYCRPDNISVDLRFPNTQCSFNHSGVLCGGCHGNLSLALGTSQCLPCQNVYATLIIVFVLAGLALVFFIKVIDLTVARGTINGLILYANIVWANKSILMPTILKVHPALRVLYTFLAWLNLDLGIETCFINGLNAYWKTWLQFVFPIYVWAITGVVIIASHYSTKASKIFGNNSVPVLATLILLSYAKLLRTIITSLSFVLLEYSEDTRLVWSFDGNIPYFGLKHSILFLVALVSLLILLVPYTTILLVLQWLRRKSYLKPLRWINRWKPFFDAYFGQLKPKHQYWVGLLLLVRIVLLLLFAATSAIIPKVNIVAIIIVALILILYQVYSGVVYKALYLSILENSFIIHLALLGIATLYMNIMNKPTSIVIYISIGIVFVKFWAIVMYHIWSRIRYTYVTYKRRHTDRDNTNVQLRVVTNALHNRVHYREPLLDASQIYT